MAYWGGSQRPIGRMTAADLICAAVKVLQAAKMPGASNDRTAPDGTSFSRTTAVPKSPLAVLAGNCSWMCSVRPAVFLTVPTTWQQQMFSAEGASTVGLSDSVSIAADNEGPVTPVWHAIFSAQTSAAAAPTISRSACFMGTFLRDVSGYNARPSRKQAAAADGQGFKS